MESNNSQNFMYKMDKHATVKRRQVKVHEIYYNTPQVKAIG